MEIQRKKWKKNAYSLDEFTDEFYQTYKEKIIQIHNLFWRIETKEIHHNLFYKASITLIPKTEKYITRTETYRPIIP